MKDLGPHMEQNLDLVEPSKVSRQVHFEAYVHLHPTSSSSSTNGDEQVELDLLAPRPLDVEKFCSVFPARRLRSEQQVCVQQQQRKAGA